ncbi:MAG: signal recognition particle-docking protein FtsY [Firmicutes bacterium]|nr:signal recognition particle-docking protein FtsY [Bacillota bacterium]
MGFFSSITKGLGKTRGGLLGTLTAVFTGRVDEEFFEELEETLICADVGVQCSLRICDQLRERAKRDKVNERADLWQALTEELTATLTEVGDSEISIEKSKLNVLLFTGVNGAGKTTTIGKLASFYKQQGYSVILAAADTFRAAAPEQLAMWAERAGVPIIRQAEGADPAAVVFDGIQAAKAREADILIVDTAGRLQNKSNLMNELSKIGRIIDREAPDANRENLLVLDAGTGQNALSQAKLFGEAVPLTGLILTKLDGTAKGGAVFGIVYESKLPVKRIGVGEGIEDLRPFVAEEFVTALLDREAGEDA